MEERKSYYDQKANVIDKLPKIKESGIWKYDAAVYSFIHQIMHSELGEYSLYEVMDGILFYYATNMRQMQDELIAYKEIAPTVEDAKRMALKSIESNSIHISSA